MKTKKICRLLLCLFVSFSAITFSPCQSTTTDTSNSKLDQCVNQISWMLVTAANVRDIVSKNNKIYIQFHTKNLHTFYADAWGWDGTDFNVIPISVFKPLTSTLLLNDTITEYVFGNLEWKVKGYTVPSNALLYIFRPFVDEDKHVNYDFSIIPKIITIKGKTYDLTKIDYNALSDEEKMKILAAVARAKAINPVPPKKPL